MSYREVDLRSLVEKPQGKRQKVGVSKTDIALGVFFGQLMFAIVAWIVASLVWANMEANAVGARVNADYEAMKAREGRQ